MSGLRRVGSTRPRGQSDVIQSDVVPGPSFLQSFKRHLSAAEGGLSTGSASVCGPDASVTHRGVCGPVERHLAVVPAVAVVTLFLEHQGNISLEQQDVETADVLPKHVVPEDNGNKNIVFSDLLVGGGLAGLFTRNSDTPVRQPRRDEG